MNKSLRISLALASGGGLGGFVSSLLGGFWIVIGFLVGGFLAYLVVDLPGVVSGVRIAWQESSITPSRLPTFKWASIRTCCIAVLRFVVAVASAGLATSAALLSVILLLPILCVPIDGNANVLVKFWGWWLGNYGLFPPIFLYVLGSSMSIFLVPLFAVLEKLTLREITKNSLALAALVNPLTMSLCLIAGSGFCAFWIAKKAILFCRWLIKTAPGVARITGTFIKAVFIEIHSDLRLLCMTDACLGSALGWLAYLYYGAMFTSMGGFPPARVLAIIGGAVVSVVLGLLNHELVAVRWMKLDVRPLFGERA